MKINKEILKKLQEGDEKTLAELMQNAYEEKNLDFDKDIEETEKKAIEEIYIFLKQIEIKKDSLSDINFPKLFESRKIKENDFPNNPEKK